MMKPLWLEVTGGKPLYLWEAFRRDYHHCRLAWLDFTKSIGAESYFWLPYSRPTGFKFAGNRVPAGWKSADRHGCSVPYAKSKDLREAINALPSPQSPDEVAAETGLPHGLRYRYPAKEPGGFESNGWESTSPDFSWHSWSPSWPNGGPIFLKGGDWITRAAEMEAKGATVTLTPHDTRTIPDGYKPVLKEYVELVFAEAKLAHAEKQKAEANG